MTLADVANRFLQRIAADLWRRRIEATPPGERVASIFHFTDQPEE